MRSGFFAVLRRHRHNARNVLAELADDRRPVGLVLDQLQRRLRPLRRQGTNSGDRGGEVHPVAYLVDEEHLHTAAGPHLTHHIVRRFGVLERHVPRLDDLVSADDTHCATRLDLGAWGAVVAPPGPFQDAALSWAWMSLVQGAPAA